jgi:hypothetical protein
VDVMALTAVKGGWVYTGLDILDKLPDPNWIGGGGVPYGWAGELTYPNTIGFDAHYQLYRDMVEWLKQNVKNYRSNTLWTKIGDCIYVQFRKKQDMMWFSLRFGA